MTPRAVRIIVVIVCIGGVAGMIVTTVLHHSGAALTFGIITAIAVLCLIVATAVAAEGAAAGATEGAAVARVGREAAGGRLSPDAEAEAAEVEEQVAILVADGADERKVRDLVREAVRLGRSMGPAATPP